MSGNREIRVVVAEDSTTVRELLVELLQSDPAIRVVGLAKTGAEAVELTTRLRPDLITMDIHMPVMAGLEATKEIMVRCPTPIVVVSSSVSRQDVNIAFDAIRAGALMVLPKPENPSDPAFGQRRDELIAMVKAMAGVKVVRRRGPGPAALSELGLASPPLGASAIVAVAASTGGPAALQKVLDLPRDFPAPILVVQHIATGFTDGLADWLGTTSDLRVKVARQGEGLAPRTVYVAPEDRHLGVTAGRQISLSADPPINGHRPSATFLFRSVARHFGAGVTAVILTGMGSDGVEGLREVRAAGGRTIAQDEATSVVYGMPREAVVAGLADTVLPVDQIAGALTQVVGSPD